MNDRPDTSANSTRLHNITAKIEREVTGLNSALFVHCSFDNKLFPVEVSISAKGKDDSTLDKILLAIGETVTKTILDHRPPDLRIVE